MKLPAVFVQRVSEVGRRLPDLGVVDIVVNLCEEGVSFSYVDRDDAWDDIDGLPESMEDMAEDLENLVRLIGVPVVSLTVTHERAFVYEYEETIIEFGEG